MYMHGGAGGRLPGWRWRVAIYGRWATFELDGGRRAVSSPMGPMGCQHAHEPQRRPQRPTQRQPASRLVPAIRPAAATGYGTHWSQVRRAFPAQALVIVRLGSLTPADAGFFLALRRQRRLVVGVRSHNPIIAPPGPGWRVRPAADLTSAGFLIPGVSGDLGPPAAGTFGSAAGRPRLFS